MAYFTTSESKTNPPEVLINYYKSPNSGWLTEIDAELDVNPPEYAYLDAEIDPQVPESEYLDSDIELIGVDGESTLDAELVLPDYVSVFLDAELDIIRYDDQADLDSELDIARYDAHADLDSEIDIEIITVNYVFIM